MNNKFKTYKIRTVGSAIEDEIAGKAGYIAGLITVVLVTLVVIVWEYGNYTGSHFGNIAIAAVLSGLISAVCFFIGVTEITNFLEQVFFCSEKFKPEDAMAIRRFAVARFLIAMIIVYIAVFKGIPWIHGLLLGPSDLAFLYGIGIL